ncbi:hypothetical protein BDW74DRAFT_1660 [Aspergillus multicolor]|uniref:uncharacterized protein n=1 Tax=Aspergillus multicolor TaxID=41759 RepID=UPI003CCCD8AF
MIFSSTTPLIVGTFSVHFFASRCWIYPAYLIGRRLGVISYGKVSFGSLPLRTAETSNAVMLVFSSCVNGRIPWSDSTCFSIVSTHYDSERRPQSCLSSNQCRVSR